jgi:hypothetical protein
MKTRLLALLVAGSVVLVGATVAQGQSQTQSQTVRPPPAYLGGGAPDALKILPPPPAPSSARERADFAVFGQTRALAGQPRWSLATDDANLAPGAGMFSCARTTTSAPGLTPGRARRMRRSACPSPMN